MVEPWPCPSRPSKKKSPRAHDLYLLVDPVEEPMSVTLLHEPSDDGYRTLDRVTVGDKLWLPEPFAMALDTAPLRV